jgi:hypothetical protein
MTRDDDTSFEPGLGRPRDRGDARVRRPTTFLKQVKCAVARAGGNPRRIGRMRSGAPKTGRFNARGRGAKLVASFPRESGWSLTERGMRFRARRVVVKARVVKMRASGSKAAYAHLRYLQRDGVTVDGERGRFYSSFEDEARAVGGQQDHLQQPAENLARERGLSFFTPDRLGLPSPQPREARSPCGADFDSPPHAAPGKGSPSTKGELGSGDRSLLEGRRLSSNIGTG